jgi:hypothetical protein
LLLGPKFGRELRELLRGMMRDIVKKALSVAFDASTMSSLLPGRRRACGRARVTSVPQAKATSVRVGEGDERASGKGDECAGGRG